MAAKKRTLNEALADNTRLNRRRSPRKAKRSTARRRESLAPKPSTYATEAYAKVLAAHARRTERLVERYVLSQLPVLGSGDPLDRAALDRGLATVLGELNEAALKTRRNARAAGRRASSHARRSVADLFGLQRIPADARTDAVVEAFAERNVRLVQKMARDQVAQIQRSIERHREGESLRQKILDSLWVSKNRGALIAKDQVNKLHYDTVQQWSLAAGSESYVYVTRRDERVRGSHRPHDGKVFLWSDPPDTGHPGTEPGCRCLALPAEALSGNVAE